MVDIKQFCTKNNIEINDIGEISDGYHTFNSLYHQRLILFAALVNAYPGKSWKSRRHSDGKVPFGGGWFIVGTSTPEGNYTYHYEDKYWGLFHCQEIEKAPEWDGHTDKDVERLLSLERFNSPPNALLTLDELRQMEGEPVYDWMGYEWFVVSEVTDEEVIMTDGTAFDVDEESVITAVGRFYRHRPEEVEK